MKLILISISVLLLTGCFYQTVDKNDLDTAVKACGGYENIYKITSKFDGGEWVICNDRREFYLNEKVWDQK
jgi:hypothetical protein